MRAVTALVIRRPGRLVIPEVVTAEIVREDDEPRRWWPSFETMQSRPAADYRAPSAHAGALLDVYG